MSTESTLPPTPLPPSYSNRNPWKTFGIAMIAVLLGGGAIAVGYIVGTSGASGSISTVETTVASSTTSTPVEAVSPPSRPQPEGASTQELDYRSLFESWEMDIPDLYRLFDGDWETFRSDTGDKRPGPNIIELGRTTFELCGGLNVNDATFDYGRESYGPEDNFLGTGIDLTAEQFDKVARRLIYNRCPDRLG